MTRPVDFRWFNASAPHWLVRRPRHRYMTVRLWNLFNRHGQSFHWWGIGLLQVADRHLFYIGRTQAYDGSTCWAVSVLFIGRT